MFSHTPGTERIYFNQPQVAINDSWWSRYLAKVNHLSPTARVALEADCRYIVDQGIFGDGPPDTNTWPSKVRTGLVMGSVQSGKTASMLGVSAMAIDQSVDIIVVLAGTRVSLWRQTYERLIRQLDPGGTGAARKAKQLLCPERGEVDAKVGSMYHLAPASVERQMLKRRPIIIVAMKQIDHLHALAKSMQRSVFNKVRDMDRPVHMLVLDDEADDGSILDAEVEAGLDPNSNTLKQIPRGIANLWNPTSEPPDNLFTTYIAYTATPQANLLQEDHNPLAPRNFLISLRTPLDIGHPIDPDGSAFNATAPRSSTYPEPMGMPQYYTGGEVFYHRGAAADLCVDTTGHPQGDIGEAVRAFLVAGAIRLARSRRMGPNAALRTEFDSPDQVEATVCSPHSMLIHPSASVNDHFSVAQDILMWAGVPTKDQAHDRLVSNRASLPDTLILQLNADPGPWQAWLDRYSDSAQQIANEFNIFTSPSFPDWSTIHRLLVDEIIPGTRVAVINSAPAADDRPEYTPVLDETNNTWRAPRDLSTIFVSGNVMARGLTLEGLTTTLFQRESSTPLADTQMQMQRWFGYRGSYIELCRVFATSKQITLFRAYHDIDEAIRVAITEQMQGDAPDPAVLQGLNFRATGKIANLHTTPLSPGAKPFIALVNSGDKSDPNAKLVTELFAKRPSTDLIAGSQLRGRILETPLSLIEAADVLNRLDFTHYKPGSHHQIAKLWNQVQARVSAVEPLLNGDLYRPPAGNDLVRLDCPYAIPAYLRLWAACLSRPVRGLFVTGQPGVGWSTVDLQRKQHQQPRFWVGIRYGEGPAVVNGPLAELPFRVLTTNKRVENGVMKTLWGSNDSNAGSDSFRGDVFFDYYHHHTPIPTGDNETAWRPIGVDGLILFYVNQTPANTHPTVATGVCLPAGGPEQFAATKSSMLFEHRTAP